MPSEWSAVVAGSLLFAGVLALAVVFGLRGGRLLLPHSRRLVGPVSRRAVECTIVRDVRTGQFKHVETCTAFADPTDVRCDEDCAALMNLGFPLAGEQGRP